MDDLDLGQTLRGFAAGQKVFGRYTLVRMLGRGGMGVVWLARDERLEQEVALKFLPEMVAHDQVAVNDLKRETRRSLQLTHPHIVRIHDFVEDSRLVAVSMEFVNGASLSLRRLEQPSQVFEPSQLHSWVGQLCEALEYAHTKAKIVHRDLKPANLMVDANGDLKIADFGISATLSDTTTRVSKQASSSGTPVYMSPQQMMGEKPAATDDIYALGATLYELLTGKPPFCTGNVLLQVQNKVPPSIAARREELSVTVAGAAGPGIPAAWEETIAACLAKQAQDRPQGAAEVWRRLNGGAVVRSEELAASREEPEPSAASPRSTSSRQSTPPRSRFRLPLVFGLAATVALGGTLGWYYGIEQPTQRRVEAQRVAEIVRQEEQRRAEQARQEQERQAEQKRQAEMARKEAEARAESEAKKRALSDSELSQPRTGTEPLRVGEIVDAVCLDSHETIRGAVVVAIQAEGVSFRAGSKLYFVPADKLPEKLVVRLPRVYPSSPKMAAGEKIPRVETENIGSIGTQSSVASMTVKSITIPGLNLELVPIPAGSFVMGSTNGYPDEKPVTQVEITRSYWLGTTEVTQAQWEAVMGSNPSGFKGADLPVVEIPYDDALEFCRKLTVRERAAGRLPTGYEYTLPTEAQWEYACRAGTTGDYAGSLDSMGWHDDNCGLHMHPVAKKQANAWGLYDMHGNVWEWCLDWKGDYPGGTVRDPAGPISGAFRVIRGGGYYCTAALCGSAVRPATEPGTRAVIGFRPALSVVR